MKYTAIIFMFLFMSINLFSAQRFAKLFMKSGSVIIGQIYDDTSKEKISLKFKDGSVLEFKYSEIERYEVSIENPSGEEIPDENSKKGEQTEDSGIWEYVSRGIDLRLLAFNFDYKEDLTPPKKSTESGWIYGVALGLSSNKKHPLWAEINLSYASADEDYDGSTQDGLPLKTTTTSSFTEYSLLAGYDFHIDEASTVSPFIGINYRSWNRKIQGSGGIEEIYSWSNCPLGIRIETMPIENFKIGISSQLNVMFYGNIDILFAKYGMLPNDVSLTLGNTNGYEISVPMSYDISADLKILCTLYYEKYEFHKSNPYFIDTQAYIYEPSSKTVNYGLRAGVIIGF